LLFIEFVYADGVAKQLLEELFIGYDKIPMPVENPMDTVKLYMGLKLSQIADIVIF